MTATTRRSYVMVAFLVVAALLVLIGGCAKIPPDRYGTNQVRIHGMKQMNEQSLARCLVTKERERVDLIWGVNPPGECGEPPFDVKPPRWELFAWSWTDWPVFDRIALEQDRPRILRWYEARGFHSAKVESIQTTPKKLVDKDTIPAKGDPGCERRRKGQGCLAEVDITVKEGKPTIVQEVRFENRAELPDDLESELIAASLLNRGDRFDEALFDQSQTEMKDILGRYGYAIAEVKGVARIDREARSAIIDYAVTPGPQCVFGEVTVQGYQHLPEEVIREAVLIDPGDPYDFDEIIDAQRAVANLGSIAAVLVEPVLPKTGNVVDIKVSVTPHRPYLFAIGAGLQGGELRTATEAVSVPQWDAHLIGRYRHHNLFGGMRQFTLEERPRMIFQERFPEPDRPRFGNTIRAQLDQPGFLEPRLKLITAAEHLYGPDPFDAFFRHRFDTEIAVERFFWDGKVYLRFGLNNSIYRVPSGETRFDGAEPPSNYVVTFPEQIIRLDLRDKVPRTHKGAMFQVTLHEAGYFLPSSWDYIRFVPDTRFYIPLPARITIAARFALGMLFVTRARNSLDPISAQLGARDWRLRGGGASSNRGFLPGRLGDGLEGGTRRWEGSLELRVPILENWSWVGFGDVGDVSREETFRFDLPQLSTGFGFRFYSPVGAIRLDFAWKIPGMQVLRDTDPRIVDLDADGNPRDRGGRFVFHLTIGEAF